MDDFVHFLMNIENVLPTHSHAYKAIHWANELTEVIASKLGYYLTPDNKRIKIPSEEGKWKLKQDIQPSKSNRCLYCHKKITKICFFADKVVCIC